MEDYVYKDMIKRQQMHWWYKTRRVLLKSILDNYLPRGSLKILEVGCGTGGNLSMLKQYGNVFAMEMNSFAASIAAERSRLDVKIGWLPENIPFSEKFDAICLFDVLEHIDDDKSALLNTSKILKPGGTIILTVPAHQLLYGIHDKMHHHFRRYSTPELKRIISACGMDIIKISHFNFILFPFLILSRLMDKFFKSKKSIGYHTPGKFINTLLSLLFSLEKYLLNRTTVPFGGSAYAVLKVRPHE